MEKKGLCCTCADDKSCAFPRKSPVQQCEEFDGVSAKSQTGKKSKAKRQ